MSLNDKRAKLKAIYADKSLTPQQRQQKIAEIMGYTFNFEEDSAENDIEVDIPECVHYQRGCTIQCPECKHLFGCRICHDNNISTHVLDRYKVDTVSCSSCNLRQPPAKKCKDCDVIFGAYYCGVCKLWESNPEKSESIFHCDKCGICRIGGEDQFRHCDSCDMCIGKAVFDAHKCFSSTFNECVVCREMIRNTPQQPPQLLKCGHGMHQICLQQYIQHDYRCPVCKKALVDMTIQYERMAAQLTALESNLENPESTPDKIETVLCNECEKQFETKFSPFRLYRCPVCNGFNTSI